MIYDFAKDAIWFSEKNQRNPPSPGQLTSVSWHSIVELTILIPDHRKHHVNVSRVLCLANWPLPLNSALSSAFVQTGPFF